MSRVGWIRLGVIAAAVALLEAACRLGLIDHRTVIAPSEMAAALWRLLASGQPLFERPHERRREHGGRTLAALIHDVHDRQRAAIHAVR